MVEKYKHINFKPPQSVAKAAEMGLEYRRKAKPSNRGGLTVQEAAKEGIGSGVQRASNLKNRSNASPKVIKQMVAFFSRHEKNKAISSENRGTPWKDKGYVAWLLWGGDPGKAWANKVLRQMEAADEKEKTASQTRVASLYLTAKNVPTNPKLWAKVQKLTKGDVKSITVEGNKIVGPNDGEGFDIFPSAYANGWASKKYKDLGGGWKKKARGKAKKDVGHGGLDEWFSGHGGAKGKGEKATWGDWVAISPVEKTLSSGKKVKPGDIVGPCGISDDPDWKSITNNGKDPLKCMPRPKAHKMPKKERAEKAKAKMRAEKKDKDKSKKPTLTPTFDKKKKANANVYKTLDSVPLNSPTWTRIVSKTPSWLDRDYPFVPQPDESCTVEELAYLARLAKLRCKYAGFIKAADEDILGLFKALCARLGVVAPWGSLKSRLDDAAHIITKLKWSYNRPRPYQAALKHGFNFKPMSSVSAHSPSYPSGHTIQSLVLANDLASFAPQHRHAFLKLAEKISASRMIAGYHFPSDIQFGRTIFQNIAMPAMPASMKYAKAEKYKLKIARKDRALLKRTEKAYQKILKAINKKPSPLVPNDADPNQSVLVGEGIGFPGLYIIFDSKSSQTFKSRSTKNEEVIVMGLKGLGQRFTDVDTSPRTALEGVKKHKNVLIHELIHYVDTRRIGDAGWEKSLKNYKSPDEDPVAYFNHPLELNAYFLQALSEMTAKIEETLSEINPRKNDNTHQTAVWSLDDWLNDYKDFKKFRRSFWAGYHFEAKKHLTSKNKRRQDKRVYDTWSKLYRKAQKTMDYLLKSGDEMAHMMNEG